ncbi:hypothetical protein LDENG_00292660 [Lucifuga dentata]|nr:hypothetical protein LDENG_00292660 [Lucifuga dentata]
MAGGSQSLWIYLLLSSVFQVSYHRHVHPGDVKDLISHTGNPHVDQIISQIPITLPAGTDPNNVNVTAIIIKTCVGLKEQLTMMDRQLQQKITQNNQLNEEAFSLRSEVRLLKLKLATCSATTSAITYQNQLRKKMEQLLETFDSDTFLILKIIELTGEVNAFEKKKNEIVGNSTETTNEISELQTELREKISELRNKTEQMKKSHENSHLILQIIMLQNQIWDLQQAESKRGEFSQQSTKQILALQKQLDIKIDELWSTGDAESSVLQLISVQNRITLIQRQISVHIQKSRSQTVDLQKQWRQKLDLLKKKILQLNREEKNTAITQEILSLQLEVEHFRVLMSNAKNTSDVLLAELRATLEKEMKLQYDLQKQMEEAEFAQTQVAMKIISMMKELRELQDDKQEQTTTTTTSQITQLQNLLEAKEKENTKARAEIKELQRKLKSKSDEWSELQDRYDKVKTDLEEKIAKLNRIGESKVALILTIITLNDELKALKGLIAATEDPDKISELQRQLEEKKQELASKTADMEKVISNPKIILSIIELQNEIWDLQKNTTTETTDHHVEELQKMLDQHIGKLEDKGNENTKLMLKIMTLQSQKEQLQKQLSDLQALQASEVTKFTNELTTKTKELEKYINELNEKNQTNANLILTVTNLQNQLRNITTKMHKAHETSSVTIAKLREQLAAKAKEQAHDHAEIQLLQNKLAEMETQCSSVGEKVDDLQNKLDAKVKELEAKSDTVTSLALRVSTLNLQLEALKKQLENTDAKSKIKELQKIINDKNIELANKTEELKSRSAQPLRFLQIFAIQTEIEKLVNTGANETNYYKITALQNHLNHLIDGIQDEKNENTKLMFKILAQQDEVVNLKKQRDKENQAELDKIKELEDELEDTRNKIKEKTKGLDTSEMRIANLSAQIMELHKKIDPLETEISQLKETYTERNAELQKKLAFKEQQLQDSHQMLNDENTKNYDLIMQVADLRNKLTQAQRKTSKADDINAKELRKQLKAEKQNTKQLEEVNQDLNQEIKDLKMCCTDIDNQCEDLQRQLEQSQADADRLLLQRNEKDADNNRQQEQLQELIAENNKLQDQYQLLEDYKNKLEENIQDLQDKLNIVENRTIHTRRITFDPSTANPRVILSEDNTEMSIGEEEQDVPHHPGRFNVALAVLGNTGFNSGRRYWEVSVAGKLCYNIGMASESANRGRAVPIRPVNGFWTIIMTKQGQLKVLDTIPTTIPIQTQPLTLGILLDYKKGEISFYDAGKRAHIYTFLGQRFTDKIYPFVNGCVEDAANRTPIVLLSPGSVDWIR